MFALSQFTVDRRTYRVVSAPANPRVIVTIVYLETREGSQFIYSWSEPA